MEIILGKSLFGQGEPERGLRVGNSEIPKRQEIKSCAEISKELGGARIHSA